LSGSSGIKKKECIVMKERRRSERLKELSEINTTVLSTENHIPEGKIFYNYSEDISVFGARIRGNVHLPVNTLLKIDFTLKKLKQKITAIGKIIWTESIIEDKYYEAGIEFINTSSDVIQQITDYISWRKKIISLSPFSIPFYTYEKARESEST
jgi:hypothetical protein